MIYEHTLNFIATCAQQLEIQFTGIKFSVVIPQGSAFDNVSIQLQTKCIAIVDDYTQISTVVMA